MNLCDGLLMRTPAYHPLESPLHYILRLSESNGYTTPTVVMQLAAPGEDWRVLARWDCKHLNKVLPACRHTPSTFMYRWPSSDHRCDLSLLGKLILSRHLNAPRAGVCPECIRELGFAPAWWDIRYVIACPTHRRMLVYNCPACGKRVLHLRRGLLRCSCGASLATDATEEPSSELLWLMELLKQKAESAAADSRSDGTQRPLRAEDADLDTLCTIIRTVGHAEHRMSGAGGTSTSLESVRRWMPAIAAFLSDWPVGVAGFCAKWLDYPDARRSERPTTRSVFPWAFEGLFRSRHEPRHRILFVVEAVLQYASTKLPSLTIDVRASDLRNAPLDQRAYCGIKQTAALSGIPQHTLVRLIRRGRLPHRTSHRGCRARYEISTEVARNLRLGYRPALLHRQGSNYLGVTHRLYQDLRRSGILKKVHATMMPKAIALCDLDKFRRNVLAKARKTARDDGLQSLDSFRRKKCPRNVMVQILDRILLGSVPCFYSEAVPQRIDELLVRDADLASLIAEFSPRPPPTLPEFQARYHLSHAEVQTLARYLSGVHRPVRRVQPGTLDEAKLNEFMARYSGLGAYAQTQKVAYLTALRHLRQENIQLLKIPSAGKPGRFVYFVPHRECRQPS